MPLLVLAHVEPDHHVLVAEQGLGERPCELRLADAGRPEEEEAPERPLRVAEPGARAPDGLRHRGHRLVLSDDARMQLLLEPQQPFSLFGGQLRHRDAGGAGDDLGDVLGCHLRRPLAGVALVVEFTLSRLDP